MSHYGSSDGLRIGVSTYDLLLALVPLCLLAGVGGAWFLPVSTAAGVVTGGAAAALVCGYGLFYRTPVPGVPAETGS